MARFKGGQKLEARLRELAKKVSNPGTLRAGFLEGATYPDGKPVAMIAAIQNFGAPSRGIPPRPFFGNVVAAGRKKWGDELGNLLVKTGYDATQALQLMGQQIEGEIRDSINNGSYVALKPATVRRKGFDKPLIDSSNMVNSVDSEVV